MGPRASRIESDAQLKLRATLSVFLPACLSAVRRHPRRSAFVVIGLALVAIALWVRLGSIDHALLDLDDATSTVVVDRRGVPLYESLSGDGTRSVDLDPRSLPPSLVAVTIAAEDRRFWSHTGVDPVAIARAVGRTCRRERSSRAVQRSRSRLRSSSSTAGRRSASVACARRFARPCSHCGSSTGSTSARLLRSTSTSRVYGNQVVGASRASRAYFAAEPSMLTPAQAAFLAGLPQRPTGTTHFANATRRLPDSEPCFGGWRRPAR